jgi:hypothetical protein
MSDYGFHRKMSPSARRIKNLRIDEVSSVSAGAGHGVRVVLMKGDKNERIESMNTIEVAKGAMTAARKGVISPLTYNSILRHVAVELHSDAKSENAALAKFLGTTLGKSMLAAQLGLPTQLGHEIAKGSKQPRVSHDQPDGLNDDEDGDDDRDAEQDFLKLVAAHMGRNPGMKRSMAEDFVRGTNEGNAAWTKYKARGVAGGAHGRAQTLEQ